MLARNGPDRGCNITPCESRQTSLRSRATEMPENLHYDGYAFHREGTRQAERDVLKDSVLAKCGLPMLRLSTVGSDVLEEDV